MEFVDISKESRDFIDIKFSLFLFDDLDPYFIMCESGDHKIPIAYIIQLLDDRHFVFSMDHKMIISGKTVLDALEKFRSMNIPACVINYLLDKIKSDASQTSNIKSFNIIKKPELIS